MEPDASWCAPGRRAGLAVRQRRRLRRQAATRRWPRTPVGWPTSTAGRSGSCGPARTSCGGARSARPVAAGMAADGTGVLRVGVSGAAGSTRTGLGRRAGRRGRGRPRPGASSRWPSPARRSPSTCGPRCGPRPPCWPRSSARAGRRGPVVDTPVEVTAPGGGRAVARCRPDGSVERRGGGRRRCSTRWCSAPTAIGAAHQALGWVGSEGIAVDADGDGPGPDRPVLRHPPGPGHAPGRRP